MPKTNKPNSNLLIEVGTEELPLSALNVIYRDLQAKTEAVLAENRIALGEVKVEATPRRIALYIEGMASKQTDYVLEISGPKWEKAFDASDKPTQVIEGFLKSKGATLKDVEAKETPKGKFVLVKKAEKGKAVTKILPELLAEIFTTLNFPKMMRWEETGFRFPRPIRWIVSLIDAKPVSFKLADIKSGNISYGHRFLSPKAFKVKNANWKTYQADLKKKHVILDLEKRKEMVRKSLQTKYKQKNIDEDLLHTATQLVEEPYMLEGSFDKDYLKLPSEVLATCMKKNQKIFACYSSGGKMVNKFVAVLNGKKTALARVRFDYENVLESRLKDARYFFDADTKEPLESKLDSLKQITYLGKLGTMFDKTKRLQDFSKPFTELADKNFLGPELKRTSRLAKIDLMTQLVFEFTELQGIIGREYALHSKENKDVALAIGSQYQPANLGESYKMLSKDMTELGALYGIIDRLDLLVGAFGTGVEPTGSQDPFALRRAGGVLVKLVRAFGFEFSLREAITENKNLYGDVLDSDPTEKLLKFLEERVAFELQVKSGSREMEILQAVWNASSENLGDVFTRFEALKKFSAKSPESFKKAVKIVERTANISKQSKEESPEIKADLLQVPQEKTLFELIEAKSELVQNSIRSGNYAEATELFGDIFFAPVDGFFEQVMVNVEDAAIRTNRQALLKRINRLYTEKVADLSVLSRID